LSRACGQPGRGGGETTEHTRDAKGRGGRQGGFNAKAPRRGGGEVGWNHEGHEGGSGGTTPVPGWVAVIRREAPTEVGSRARR
jgi:hypothetical protein